MESTCSSSVRGPWSSVCLAKEGGLELPCPERWWGSQAGRAGSGQRQLCLGVGAVERQSLCLGQRPGRGLSEAKAAQPDVLQGGDLWKGSPEDRGSHPYAITGKLYSCFCAVGKFLLLHVIYWKVSWCPRRSKEKKQW